MQNFRFVEKKNLWFSISILLILAGFAMMGYRALKAQSVLNFGVDFTGGSTFVLKFEELEKRVQDANQKNASLQDVYTQFTQDVRDGLKPLGLQDSSIQISNDNEVLIKTGVLDNAGSENLFATLQKSLGKVEVQEMDFIGPSMGAELRQKSLWILAAVCAIILIYITWRFEFSYGVAAIVALLHDGLITVSFASLLWIEIDNAFVAALLTILGYSINDTVIIFDRVRENIHLVKSKKFDFVSLINFSLKQTLWRTLNTSTTTLGVTICLLVFGGATIRSFCLALLIGITTGTYSSIFIAAPLLPSLQRSAEQQTQ